jgi:hypothetical protein
MSKARLEIAERGILMNLLSERRRWPLAEVEARINDEAFEQCLKNLEDGGLVGREGDEVFATPAAIRGDDLSL